MKNIHKVLAMVVFGFISLTTQTQAAILYSQDVTLASGWNIVSTPRVLDSHAFSVAETSTNFDIYILNGSNWSTMADLGQSEFTPLYGYFINNKTESSQILTFNYKASTTPNERLFERTFSTTGWYSFGVANPTYAVTQYSATSTDTNNPTNILSSLQSSDYNMAVDFTAGNFASNADSVAVSSTWDARSVSDGINKLNDFRDTKGYAVYILNTSSLYSGFQNDSIPQCSDGIDNDTDGFVDFPADGGCSSASDNSEAPGVPAIEVTSATSSVPSQNISVNIGNQVLGGYDVDITEEPISVQSHVFHFNFGTTTDNGELLTSVSLYDENGMVVAGPVDATNVGGTEQKVTFADTVTYSIGKNIYTLKGKLPSTISNGQTLTASTTPSSDWTSVTGQTTGNAVSLSTLDTAVTMNTMTAKTAALAISMSTTPAAQTIIAGGTGVTFANLQFDASQSGEDVRFSSVALSKSAFTGLSSCKLFDGSTALNTGSNILNPVATTTETITFDQSLTVIKGTVKTLTLKCNVSSSASGSYAWTITPSSTNPTVTGVTSGSSVIATGAVATSNVQTIGTTSLTVSISPSSPSYSIAAAGTTGQTAAVLRFRAANEAVNLSRIGLTLTNTSSSSASDILQVSIWDGTTQIGTATFTGTNTTATSTLTSTVLLPKDADKNLTVKVDLAQIGAGYTGTQGALIAVDIDTNGTNTQGVGQESGTTVNASGSTSVAGIRLFKSFPTFALDTLSSTGMADGKLMRFKVTANTNGEVGINQFKFTMATTSATATTLNLFGYTDASYSNAITTSSGAGQIATSNANVSGTTLTITPSSVVSIPAGTIYYFELRGTVAGVTTGSSITTTLMGDSAYPSLATHMGTSATVVSTGGNLIWSPNATTTSTAVHDDWTNSYGVVGLPSSGLIQSRSN